MRKKYLKEENIINCVVCNKSACRRMCSKPCSICRKPSCNSHNTRCVAYHSDNCLLTVCDNCLSEYERRHLELVGPSAYRCVICRDFRPLIVCCKCGKYLRKEEDETQCSQGHPYCDYCATSAIYTYMGLDEHHNIEAIDLCMDCYKSREEKTKINCDICPESMKIKECLTCSSNICIHNYKQCFRGHRYCKACAKDNFILLTKKDNENIKYNICFFCIMK